MKPPKSNKLLKATYGLYLLLNSNNSSIVTNATIQSRTSL